MRLAGPLWPGLVLRRLSRFTVEVQLATGECQLAHLANSGRLAALVRPLTPCLLRPARDRSALARTHTDLLFVSTQSPAWPTSIPPPTGRPSPWVSVSATLPNQLVAESLAVRPEAWQAVLGWPLIEAGWKQEVRLGHQRLDFWLGPAGEPVGRSNTPPGLWLEVKSVTDVQQGCARFPDAPTARGQRHLEELRALARQGGRAAVIFVVQREDARAFAPNDGIDPAFGGVLRAAAAAGVQILALPCRVRPPVVELVVDPLPLCL